MISGMMNATASDMTRGISREMTSDMVSDMTTEFVATEFINDSFR